MQHVLNLVSDNVSKCGTNVWYVDSGALNHMTNHGEWFQDIHDPKRQDYVETRDRIAHPIAHV